MIVLALLLAASAPLAPQEPSTCPALFGSEDVRKAGAARRQSLLVGVHEAGGVVDVVHSASWTRPAAVRFAGVELLGSVEDPGGVRRAVVEVGPELAPVCTPGLYGLRVDDTIGPARILAVLDAQLLLELEDRLVVVSATGARAPTFRMSWASPWRLQPATRGTGGGAQPARAPQRAPRKR